MAGLALDSLSRQQWPWTSDPPASTFWVLRLQVCDTTPVYTHVSKPGHCANTRPALYQMNSSSSQSLLCSKEKFVSKEKRRTFACCQNHWIKTGQRPSLVVPACSSSYSKAETGGLFEPRFWCSAWIIRLDFISKSQIEAKTKSRLINWKTCFGSMKGAGLNRKIMKPDAGRSDRQEIVSRKFKWVEGMKKWVLGKSKWILMTYSTNSIFY